MQGLKWAAISAVLGYSAWGTMELAQEHGIVSLDPQPVAFDMDKSAYSIFSKLHKFRKINDEMDALYRRMLRQTDKIFVLEKKLANGMEPDYEDGLIVMGYTECAKDAMGKFLLQLHGKRLREAKEISNDFDVLLKAHASNVFRKTRDAPVYDLENSDDDSDSE